MARDPSLAVRRAILAALEDSAAVTAIVPPDRLHAVAPPADPAWPFVRYGLAASAPLRASGLDGARLAITLYGCARGPQEDAAADLGTAIAAALDGRVLALDGDPAARAHLAWTGSRLRRDDAGTFEIAVAIEAIVA